MNVRDFLFRFGACFLIAVLVVSVWSGYSKLRLYEEKSQLLEETISHLNQQLQITELRLRDSVTIYQAEVKNLSITKRNLERANYELLEASRLKAKDVASITSALSKTSSRDTVIAEVDTFGGLTASLVDPFVNINVCVSPQRVTIIDYEVRDSITVLVLQKRHSWLFGLIKWNEHKATRVINHNPKARVTDVVAVDVID